MTPCAVHGIRRCTICLPANRGYQAAETAAPVADSAPSPASDQTAGKGDYE